MAENEKAVLAADTPSDEQPASAEEAAEIVEEAQESVDDLRERIRDLEAKSTKAGRSHAREIESLKRELETVVATRDKAVSDNKAWVERELRRKDLTADQRRTLERTLGVDKAETKTATENAMLRAILKEENPRVKAALQRRVDRGRFLTTDEIDDLRADLLAEEDDGDDKKTEKKPAPRVSGVRTAGQVTRSPDAQIKEAASKKDISGVWEGMVEKARATQQIRRSG